MPNATVRANARTLPEATERPQQPALTSDAIQALAADFEAAWAAERVIFKNSSTDDEANVPKTSGEYMRTPIRSPIFTREEART